jgi:hypothetical protein
MPATIAGPVAASPGLPGGCSSALNITVPQVIKAAPGIAVLLSCLAPGSAGSLTLNNCISTGAATAANEFFSALFSALSVGKVVKLNWPCAAGITLSSVPTGFVGCLSFS